MNESQQKYGLLENESTQEQQGFGQPPQVPPPYNFAYQPNPQATVQQPTGQIGQHNVISHVSVQPPPVIMQPQQTYNVVNTTTVVTTQPQRTWRTGVCNCCGSCRVCMCVWCFGICYSCNIATRMGESCWAGATLSGTTAMRTKFRMIHNIEGSVCDDVCTNMFCWSCMMCQLGREMDAEQYPAASCCCSCCSC